MVQEEQQEHIPGCGDEGVAGVRAEAEEKKRYVNLGSDLSCSIEMKEMGFLNCAGLGTRLMPRRTTKRL